MMNFKKYLLVTWSVLYVGLKNNWLTTKEVTTVVNDSSDMLNCRDNTLVDINVNDNDKKAVLEILEKQIGLEENNGVRIWQLAHLVAIEQSELSIHQKLKEIETQWSAFDYPEAWRDFIYYMPNDKVSTEEGVYQIFLNFLSEEKERLNWRDIAKFPDNS